MDGIEGIAFFVCGAWLAMRDRALFQPARWLEWLVPSYLTMLAADVAQRVLYPSVQPFYAITVATGVVLILAVISLLQRPAARELSSKLVALSGASFFVFAAHEPLMTLARKLLYRIAPPSQLLIFAGYVGVPLLIAIGLTAAYFVLRSIAPKFLAAVTGGR